MVVCDVEGGGQMPYLVGSSGDREISSMGLGDKMSGVPRLLADV